MQELPAPPLKSVALFRASPRDAARITNALRRRRFVRFGFDLLVREHALALHPELSIDVDLYGWEALLLDPGLADRYGFLRRTLADVRASRPADRWWSLLRDRVVACGCPHIITGVVETEHAALLRSGGTVLWGLASADDLHDLTPDVLLDLRADATDGDVDALVTKALHDSAQVFATWKADMDSAWATALDDG